MNTPPNQPHNLSFPSRIGLIAVGLMGIAMARRLIAAGRGVLGFDIAPPNLDALSLLGGEPAPGARAVAAGCDLIILSLPDSTIAERVLEEIESNLKPGQIIVDTTTGDPRQMAAQGGRLAALGVAYLDASISGSSALVAEGRATVMAGGPRDAFDRCADIFRLIAAHSFHLGGWGAGARMKLVTNLVLGLNRAALAEGIALARALDLDLDATLGVLRASPAYSRMADLKGEKMIRGDFEPQARLSQHLKDVRLIQAAGDEAGLRLPLTDAHRELLEFAETLGLGAMDNSAVLRAVEAWTSRENDT